MPSSTKSLIYCNVSRSNPWNAAQLPGKARLSSFARYLSCSNSVVTADATSSQRRCGERAREERDSLMSSTSRKGVGSASNGAKLRQHSYHKSGLASNACRREINHVPKMFTRNKDSFIIVWLFLVKSFHMATSQIGRA